MIQKVDKGTAEVTDYVYDADNQLVEIKVNTVTIAQYRYDGLGRRIEKDVSGVVTRYVLDNEDILFEFDGSNVQQARYTHGAGIDEPLIMDRGGQSFFYHADGLGSIIDLTDNAGVFAQSYIYDSFGQIITVTSGLVNPYTYTSREFDGESGLYYYRFRYYDPSSGRFLQEDPTRNSLLTLGSKLSSTVLQLPEQFNQYVYVLNNPINETDPLGLFSGDLACDIGCGALCSVVCSAITKNIQACLISCAVACDLLVCSPEDVEPSPSSTEPPIDVCPVR